MTIDDDSNTAEKLFGSVKKLKATGNHKPDSYELVSPFEWGKAVSRACCTGCGVCREISFKLAKEYAEAAGINLPEDLEKYYFSTGRCNYCDSNNNDFELLPISAI